MKKLSRKVLSSLLVFTLGITSSGLTAFAKDENELDWEITDNLVTKNEKFTPEKDETIDEDETVRTLIVFDDKSAIEKGYDPETISTNFWAKLYTSKLEKKQDQVIDTINEEVLEGNEMDVRYRFTTISNAVSTELTYGEVLEIRDVKGVKDVYVLPQYSVEVDEPNTTTSGDMVGSYLTWESGYTGAGMRVAIIDTGLDTDHPSFDADAYLYALNEEAEKDGKDIADYDLLDLDEIASVMDDLFVSQLNPGYSNEDFATLFYWNEKVPFGFDYIDVDTDVNHDEGLSDHGTHVAGIATANKYVATDDGYTTQENGVVGIAPNAQVMVMKVFGENGGAYTDDYMTAIQDALILGADSINLSLGSSNPGESQEYSAAEQYVNAIFDSLNGSDTVVAISAGNSGMWADSAYYYYDSLGGLFPEDVNMQTNGSPGSYTNALTVASADNTGLTGYGFDINGTFMIYGENTDDGNAPFTSLASNEEGTELEYVLLDSIGTLEDYEGIDVTNKVVFVKRGEINFSVKYNNAASLGAKAVVIYNNVAGSIGGMSLEGINYKIPCVSVTLSDGETAKAAATQISDIAYEGTLTTYPTAITIKNYDENASLSYFSSWGVPGDLSLKPEITAPGGNIWSTIEDGYGLMSGTSMASPSIAGMSALVIEYIEENGLTEKTGLSSRTLAQSLLMGTATPLSQDGTYYSPRKQGAGLANVNAATTSPVYIMMNEDGKVKAELGDDPERTGVYTIDFTLYNLTDEKQYYIVDTTTLTEELVGGLIVGDSYELNPTVTVDGAKYLLDIDQDDDVDQDDALILLQVVNGSTTNEYVTANENEFDLNGNGVLDTTDVHILLKVIDLGNMERVVVVEDETNVSVTIELSEEDKAYLDATFANGIYVDGFIQLDGHVDLTIPFLAFYGNWADPNMFEHVDYLDFNENTYSYSNTFDTNVFVDKDGYVVGGNPLVEDDEYLSERNAISSEFGNVGGAYYTLIRNSAVTRFVVTDQETNEVYYTQDLGDQYAEYYYTDWENTQIESELAWNVTDANGQPLAEGTKVNISLVALPEYYADSTDIPGKGSAFTVPLTVDNTAPEITSVTNNGDGTINVTFKDNQYAAAIQVYNRDYQVIEESAVNQSEVNTEMTKVVTITEEVLATKVLYVSVIDYAGNVSTARINFTGIEDAQYATDMEIRYDGTKVEEMTAFVGKQTQLYAYVFPETLENTEVTWESSDPSVATVTNGVVYGVSRGTATITATSLATTATGEHLTATCKVTVDDNNFVAIHDDWTQEFNMNWNSFYAGSVNEGEDILEIGTSYISATEYGPYLFTSDSYGYLYLNNSTSPYLRVGIPFCDMTWGQLTGYLIGIYGPNVYWIDLENLTISYLEFGSYIGDVYLTGITYAGWGYDNPTNPSDYVEYYAVSTTNGDIYYLTYKYFGDSPYTYQDIVTDTGLETEYISHSSLTYDDENGLVYWSALQTEILEYEGEPFELFYSNVYMYDQSNGVFNYLSSSDLYQIYCGLVSPELSVFETNVEDTTEVESIRVNIDDLNDADLVQQVTNLDPNSMTRLPENVLKEGISEFDGNILDRSNINIYRGGNN